MSHNWIVTSIRVPLAGVAISALLLLAACAKNINNKEAVRAAVVEYLGQKAQATGLNVAAMEVTVASVSFEKDQAQAIVSIRPKGMSDGMNMTYALLRKGDKWEVKSKQDSGVNPHGAGAEIPASGGGAADPALPPGHPPAGASK